jgi:hypothetical protein
MNPEDLKNAWQSQPLQPKPPIDLLLKEVERNQRNFETVIFRRDAREIGVALILLPVWVVLGITLKLPWTWYLAMPALVWVAGFMLVYRRRHMRPAPSDASLRENVRNSLNQMDHQIWLLRNILWWYLMPLNVAIAAFFLQVGWIRGVNRADAFVVMLFLFGTVAFVMIVVYWANQRAVRVELEPRRRELQELMDALGEESSAVQQGN